MKKWWSERLKERLRINERLANIERWGLAPDCVVNVACMGSWDCEDYDNHNKQASRTQPTSLHELVHVRLFVLLHVRLFVLLYVRVFFLLLVRLFVLLLVRLFVLLLDRVFACFLSVSLSCSLSVSLFCSLSACLPAPCRFVCPAFYLFAFHRAIKTPPFFCLFGLPL